MRLVINSYFESAIPGDLPYASRVEHFIHSLRSTVGRNRMNDYRGILCVISILPSLLLGNQVSAAPRDTDQLPIELVASLETLGEVRLSPDGRHVAYVLGQMSTPAGAQALIHIWMLPVEGGDPTRLLAGDRIEFEPRWSPDGRSIAYIAAGRGEARQVYTVKQDGTGERLLAGTAGASNLEWSPDGRYLSFSRRDPNTPKRKPGDPIISGAGDPSRLWVVEVANGAVRAITGEELSVSRDYAWSPDSTMIVIPAESATEWVVGRQTLYIASVAESTTRVMAFLHDRTIALAWSPDGEQIVWCGREHAEGSGQLVVFETQVEEAQTGTTIHAEFPASIQWIEFLPDGRLALAALKNLRLGLYSLSPRGGPIEEVASPDVFGPGSLGAGSWGRFTVSLSADGSVFATSHSGPSETGNVVAGEWGNPGKLRGLTRINPHIEKLPLGETEQISWMAPDGLRIYGLLIRPLGYKRGERYPMIVELHGGPRRSFWDTSHVTDSWGQILATRGYMVLLPNPRGSEGRGAEFVRAGTNTGLVDLPDVLAGIDHVIARGDADPDRIGIGGWSYGGFLTAWAITQTTRFKAAVVGAGYVNQISREGQTRGNWQFPQRAYEEPEALLRNSPIMFMKQVRTPTLIIHGDNDNTVPTAQSVELYTALRSLGVPTERVLYPGETHIFTETGHIVDRYRRVVEWFDKHVMVAQGASVASLQ